MHPQIAVNRIVVLALAAQFFVSLSLGQLSFAQHAARVVTDEPIPYGGGFCDRNKRIIIEPRYDHVGRFSEGLAAVKTNGKWGFIDQGGKEVVPLKYDDAWQFNEGLAAVSLDRKWGFVNASGHEVGPLKYDVVHNFTEGLALVELNLKMGYIDMTAKEVVPLMYDSDRGLLLENGIPPVREGLAVAILHSK